MSFDTLDEVLRQMESSPTDAYWARRLLDLVRDPGTAARLRSAIVAAVQCWVARDPSFFVHERYLSEQLAVWTWPREILEDLDAQLTLEDASLRHLVLGRLWLEARRPPKDMLDFYGRAAKHLSLVEEPLQIGAWHEAFCEALGVTDPDVLATRAVGILESATPERRERALLAILRGAARTANWDLYDAHRRLYGADETTRRDSEIIRLDGQRAELSLRRREDLAALFDIALPTYLPPARR